MNLVELRSPLVSMDAVQAAFNCDWQTARARVQDGRLEYVFDLRQPPARNGCLRVFAGSLAVAQGRAQPSQFPDLDTVLRQIVPGSHDPTAASVARQFNCDSKHVYNLLEGGLLRPAGVRKVRRGPTGSQRICRQSLMEFLKSRRVL